MRSIKIETTGVVGFSGYATCGKDLLCELIKERGGEVKRFALADKLKEAMNPFIQEQYGVSLYGCTKEEKELLRPLMVAYSKLHRFRSKGAYFAKKIEKEIKEYSKTGLAIITDIRFAEFEGTDELWWVKDLGRLVHLTKWQIKNNRKVYIGPPNKEEAENTPKLQNAADYNIEWPHANKGLSCLNRYVDNLIVYLNESLKR